MCGLYASFNNKTFMDLHRINTTRGQHSSSLTHIKDMSPDINTFIDSVFDPISVEMIDNVYKIGHIQAPTSASARSHPARECHDLLWHNGLVKSFDIKRIQGELNIDEEWDTMLILQSILKMGWSSLSMINGSFACVGFINESLVLFRNEISPLFIDDQFSISSVKFPKSTSLPPNTVFELNLADRKMNELCYFETKENPYYFS